MKRLALAFWILFALPAMAQNINLAWDPYADAALIAGFHLYQTKNPGSYTPTVTQTYAPSATTGSTPRPGLGNWCWVLTAFTSDNIESGYSNEVCTVIKPNPPHLQSAVMAVIQAPVNVVKWAFGKEKKGLRIVKS